MSSMIATRLSAIKPSPTLAITAKANKLKSQGEDIISLGAGEPDFDTPDNIKQAAIAAINNGFTKYTDVGGTAELKKAVINKFKRENGLEYNADEIIVSCGGKHVIYNLFMSTINKNDEIIIPAPYWVSYPDMVLLAEGRPVFIETDMNTGFKISPAQLEETITDKTKWLILNSPSNPSGATYSKDELLELAKILSKHPHVYIMTDDIYEHIIFDEFQFLSLATVAPELKNRIFIVNGVSKSYSMTGWRIGYGAGAKDIIKAMTMLQSQVTSNPSSISQAAAVEALNGEQFYIKKNAKDFQQKRDLVLQHLKAINGLECYKSEGAFYLFPKCSDLFGKKTPSGVTINSSSDLAEYFLDYSKLAVVPGSAFGLEGYFRISYATSIEILQEACKRMSNAITMLK